MSGLFIGLMTGTSIDGVDVSIIETDGHIVKLISDYYVKYTADLYNKISYLIDNYQKIDLELLLEIEKEFTIFNADAVKIILQRNNLSSDHIKAVAFHGQTLFHNGKKHISYQMGDPDLLSSLIGIDVIFNLRKKDLAYGGQGAPIIPIYHKAIISSFVKNEHHLEHNLDYTDNVIINIGGISNITYFNSKNNDIIAFDAGPGNCVIDYYTKHLFDQDFDNNGELASGGSVNFDLVNMLINDDFFMAPYPKSLDKLYFVNKVNNIIQESFSDLDKLDIVASVSYFTSLSIIKSLKQIKFNNNLVVYLSGGGAHNKFLLKSFDSLLHSSFEKDINRKINLYKISDLSPELNEDFIESQGMAFIAARYYYNLPSSFGKITNASKDNIILGCLSKK